ncbi:pilus assembly protein [Pseudaminobacter sp. 19-2017]|uniref:Pilus assembly protein n=1 Tax=Pseudaminobacter soli (ex Zhang et al. 2022) TaxID=2831468 RepID=A0A942E410_9HYPH|nr:TadE family protein [Pseudaminobacter soli]MBS3648102.1 pilus assembly protein [Pseudaminobacter soli]
MVRHRSLRRFLGEEAGVTLVEGLISLPIVMLAFAAFVEFGYAMFQWNQTVKALQLGARLVAVSDRMLTQAQVTSLSTSTGGVGGQGLPADGLSFTCVNGGSAECQAGLRRLVNGSGRWPGLRAFNPRIGLDNVAVTYTRSGLGYHGRPNGAVVTIRLEARNITFNLPLLGGLLGLNTITIPPMPVTITSEDLSTSSS